MKAIIWTEYGPPESLQLREVAKPIPKDDEVLIKIFAASVTVGDTEMRSLALSPFFRLPLRFYFGFTRPRKVIIYGSDLAGEVEAVGKDVKLFKPGDQVFAGTGFKFGANAEYTCLPEKLEDVALALKPPNMTYEEASAVPVMGLNALHFMRRARIQKGEKVLINGAGGSIGTYAVQLAKDYGAEVTAIDSADKLEMLRSIGADHVIDYTQEDFSRSGKTYDVILDVVGKSPFWRSLKILKRNGRYLLGNPKIRQILFARLVSRVVGKKVVVDTAALNSGDLVAMRELIEADKVKSVIDRSYPMEQVIEAHKFVETGKKKGNVVLTINRKE